LATFVAKKPISREEVITYFNEGYTNFQLNMMVSLKKGFALQHKNILHMGLGEKIINDILPEGKNSRSFFFYPTVGAVGSWLTSYDPQWGYETGEEFLIGLLTNSFNAEPKDIIPRTEVLLLRSAIGFKKESYSDPDDDPEMRLDTSEDEPTRELNLLTSLEYAEDMVRHYQNQSILVYDNSIIPQNILSNYETFDPGIFLNENDGDIFDHEDGPFLGLLTD